jgi:hypothetical protein
LARTKALMCSKATVEEDSARTFCDTAGIVSHVILV